MGASNFRNLFPGGHLMFQPSRSRVSMFVFLSVLAILSSGCGSSAPQPQPAPPPQAAVAPPTPAAPVAAAPLPVWEPDPAVLDELEPYRDVEGYEIRLPKGCETVPPPQNVPYLKALGWKGPPRENGSRFAFAILLITAPPSVGDYASSRRNKNSNSSWKGSKRAVVFLIGSRQRRNRDN